MKYATFLAALSGMLALNIQSAMTVCVTTGQEVFYHEMIGTMADVQNECWNKNGSFMGIYSPG
jgi:hypothetical protein